ncbi:MAG: hypothetical protein A2538_04230 [Candidatus Magasanikbacteria bacterium RIFOXYD2_FULL_41_14]|uniref:DNA 3'-5' helicase n=1 Tax=Candidatus Magasanikbacteria bacterium RIFOXYD2_FULL_41_14 TaxID=1798709 RepID=A0A1F6PBU4_9BACT|nr:MAG: hypothetical protein A2538_04230 [Candidatus Magasanikbacteria bacterium RIFOXYD2_FULL_41_14]
MPSYPLNPSQQEAIRHTSGPLLIVAGAGTGKTTVITEKIAYLVNEKNIPAKNILALAFTEKAAGEMTDRVGALMPDGGLDITTSTFHSLGRRILETHGLEVGLPNNFKVLNEIEVWLLIRQNLEKFDLDYFRPLGNPTKFIHALIKHFSRCKDELITPEKYLAHAENLKLDSDTVIPVKTGIQSPSNVGKTLDSRFRGNDNKNDSGEGDNESDALIQKRANELSSAYHLYNQILLDNDCLDFSDLIFYTVKLLRERPNVLKIYQNIWPVVLVDEFQDTNWAQYELIKLLAKGRENAMQLTVVGDDDQSIYKFRGASVANILQFSADFPKSKQIVLTENYRSGQTILDYAHNFIKLNDPDRLEAKLGLDKKLTSATNKTATVKFETLPNAASEGQWIAKNILELKKNENLEWGDFVVLCRTHQIAEQILPALLRHKIPTVSGGESGYLRAPAALNCQAAFKLADNYHESPAVYRLLNSVIYDLPYEDASKLALFVKRKACSLYQAVKAGQTGEVKLSEAGEKIAVKFLADTNKLAIDAKTEPAIKVLYNFLENSGYLKKLADYPEKNYRDIMALQAVFDYLEKFQADNPDTSVAAWMRYYEFALEAGETGEVEANIGEGVPVLTIHSAKGLEFEYVFIPSLVDLRFPSTNRAEAIELPTELINEKTLPEGDVHLEEERRLFYVALTRAKSGIFLSAAKDYGGAREKKLSRFVAELEKTNNVKLAEQIPSKGEKIVREIHQPNTAPLDKQLTTPESFSFSQISTYQTCPWQYRFKYILHIPTLGKGVFSFGHTLHITLQKFYERLIALNSAHQGGLFDAPRVTPPTPSYQEGDKTIIVPKLEELLELYRANWQDDWFYSAENKKRYRADGETILKNFYKVNSEQGWTIPAGLETGFRFKVAGAEFKGQIDRIDKLPDGKIRLIDYKTGKPKTKLAFNDKLQLLVYQWAATSISALSAMGEIGTLSYFYLTDGTEVDFMGTDKDLEKTAGTVEEIIKKIQNQDFTATPDPETCRYCDFKDICEFRR